MKFIMEKTSDGNFNHKSTSAKPKLHVTEVPEVRTYPAQVTAHTIFDKSLRRKQKPNSSTDKKAPNKFLIYRVSYCIQLRQMGHSFSMTEISGAIAERWKMEPDFVKLEYGRIATEVDELHRGRFGDTRKKNRRRGPQIKSSSSTASGFDFYTQSIPNIYPAQDSNNNLKYSPYPHMLHPYGMGMPNVNICPQSYQEINHVNNYTLEPVSVYNGISSIPQIQPQDYLNAYITTQ